MSCYEGDRFADTIPYAQRQRRGSSGGIEFRNYLGEVFNGLIDLGFTILRVFEEPGDLPDSNDSPGSYRHWGAFIGGAYSVLARKT